MTFPAVLEISHVRYNSKTRTHDIFCTCPVTSEISYFMYIFKTKTHAISCGIRNLMCPAHFHDQGHVTFIVHFLTT